MSPEEKRARQAAYQRKWYAANRDQHKALVEANRAKYRERNRQILKDAKDVPCMDCGVQYHPWAMEFDHRIAEDKEHTVSKLVNAAVSERVLLDEIAKCDVVCANCHRVRTALRAGWEK